MWEPKKLNPGCAPGVEKWGPVFVSWYRRASAGDAMVAMDAAVNAAMMVKRVFMSCSVVGHFTFSTYKLIEKRKCWLRGARSSAGQGLVIRSVLWGKSAQ
jgi:hypothetical protein